MCGRLAAAGEAGFDFASADILLRLSFQESLPRLRSRWNCTGLRTPNPCHLPHGHVLDRRYYSARVAGVELVPKYRQQQHQEHSDDNNQREIPYNFLPP